MFPPCSVRSFLFDDLLTVVLFDLWVDHVYERHDLSPDTTNHQGSYVST